MDFKIDDLSKYKHIHLIGIGGVSMSAIAETLNNWKYHVTGSDIAQSIITDNLNKHGIKTTIGHDLENSKNDQSIPIVSKYNLRITQEQNKENGTNFLI